MKKTDTISFEDNEVVDLKSQIAINVLAGQIAYLYKKKLKRENRVNSGNMASRLDLLKEDVSETAESLEDRIENKKVIEGLVGQTHAVNAYTYIPNYRNSVNGVYPTNNTVRKEQTAYQQNGFQTDKVVNQNIDLCDSIDYFDAFNDRKDGKKVYGGLPMNHQTNGDFAYLNQRETGVYANNMIQSHLSHKGNTFTVEKPVITEVIVEKPYDVIVEVPIKNVIEKEVVIEKFIENPIERVIENEVEHIIEEEREIIIEQPVITEYIIEKEYETIIDKEVEMIKEVEVPKNVYVDRTIPRTVLKPTRKEYKTKEVVVEEPVYEDVIVEKAVRKEIPVYKDVNEYEYVEKEVIKEVNKPVLNNKIKEIIIEKPYKKVIDVPERKVVKKPIKFPCPVNKPVETVKEVNRRVPKMKYTNKEKPIYVDKIVMKPVDRVIEKPYYVDKRIERPKELIKEKVIEIPKIEEVVVEEIVEKPVEKTRNMDLIAVKRVNNIIEQPKETIKHVEQVNEHIIPIEKVVEKRVPKTRRISHIVEREKFVEVPVEKIVEKEIVIDKIVTKPVYIEKVVEIPKEVIVEKRVEVPVTKYVEVPKEIVKDRVVELNHVIEKPVYVEKEVDSIGFINKRKSMKERLMQNDNMIRQMESENNRIKDKIRALSRSVNKSKEPVIENKIGYEKNIMLRNKLEELTQVFNNEEKRRRSEKKREIQEENTRQRVKIERASKSTVNPIYVSEKPKQHKVEVRSSMNRTIVRNSKPAQEPLKQSKYSYKAPEVKFTTSIIQPNNEQLTRTTYSGNKTYNSQTNNNVDGHFLFNYKQLISGSKSYNNRRTHLLFK